MTAVDAALAALRVGNGQDGCKLLVGLDAPRVLWANRNAEALFDTRERLTLSRKIFGSASEGRPLATRLSRLEPGASASLEGIRIASRFAHASVVFSCTAVPGASPKMILLEAVAAHQPQPASQVFEPPPLDDARQPQRQDLLRVDAESAAAIADPRERDGGNRFVRFTWRSDGRGLVAQVGPEMQAALGRTALQVGDNLENRLRAIGSAPAREAADALASGQSWSGSTVAWPFDEPAEAVDVTLGGTPVPGAVGYRGFGLIERRPSADVGPSDDAEDVDVSDAADRDDVFDGAMPTVAVDEGGETQPLNDERAAPDTMAGAHVSEPPAPPAAMAEPDDVGSGREVPVAPHADEPVTFETAQPTENALEPRPLPDVRVAAFPRAIQSGTAKIVHLAAFKTGLPAMSGKAAVRREPPPSPLNPEGEAVALSAPQWAEAPSLTSASGPDQRLSSHERFNFDEIARALATLPLAEAGRAERMEPSQAEASDKPPAARGDHAASTAPADYRQVIDALPAGVLIARGDTIAFANRTLLDLVGYDDAGALEQAGGLARLFGALDPGDGRTERRLLVHKRDGTELHVDAAVRRVSWAGGPAILWWVRIADPQAVPARLAAPGPDTSDLAEALELAASGVGFLDGRGRVVGVNGGAERLLGYGSRDLVGEDAGKLFTDGPDEGWTAVFGPFAGTAPARTSAYRKMIVRTRSGEDVPVGVSLRRIGPDRICIIWQQSVHGHATASELDLLRRDAERASALKSEFLAKISHEIRTPLNAMLGFTEIIIDERFGPIGNDRYREYLKDIHASGTHVVSLVNDLLDLSRIEAGALELTLGPVDVNAVIGECVAAMQGQAYRDRVVVRSSLASCGPLALADDRSFRQIVLNLLSNAVKFNEPGGQVILSTAVSDAGRVLVRVRDTGPGMSDSDIETAMKPFRQLATPKASAGTGLGLPLTKAMIEACHGSLRITSKPGEGTLAEATFQRAPDLPVSLPAE